VLRTWYPSPGVVESAAVNRDFEGGFAVALLHKDLGLAVNAGESTGTPLPFVTQAHEAMASLMDAGLANKDCSVLVKKVDGTLQASSDD
jgi:3-hydroxyisobutyrate dehydrogenase